MKALWIMLKTLLVLVVLVLAALGVLYGIGTARLQRRPTNPIPAFAATSDSAALARGRHIAEVICRDCHGMNSTLPLAGNDVNFGDVPDGPHLGELHATNLTPGGVLGRYSDGALARAIREGVAADGRVMLVMPSPQFHRLSDDDLRAIIAYLRSQPAVHRDLKPPRLNALGRVLLGAGVFDTSLQPPVTAPVAAVPADSTARYGEYLVGLLGCRDCHGKALRGPPRTSLAPRGPDLVTLLATHPHDRFALSLRAGVGADGHPLDPTKMPWPTYSTLTNVETEALYRYIGSLGQAP